MLSKKTLMITIISVLCLVSLARAEEGKSESKIDLIPVYEKTFDDTIVDVIFDTTTVSIEEAKRMGWKEEAFRKMKISEKINIIYPKVVVTKRQEEGKAHYHYGGINRSYGTDDVRAIKFYNKMGNLVKVIDAEIFKKSVELLRSPNGKYFCIAKWPEEFGYYDYRGGTLYNADGRMVWEIDTLTPIAISDDGFAIAAYVDWDIPPEPGGKFYLFDNKGKLIKIIENPDSAHLIARFAKFSDDGEWAIVVFKKETFPPTHIILIKKTGEVVWERYFAECRVSAMDCEFGIIPYKGVVGIWDNQLEVGTGAFLNTEVFFIDWQGELKWTIPLGIRGWMIINLSEGNDKVCVASTAGYLWCIDVQSGGIIWTYKESWAPELRTMIRYYPNALAFREMKISSEKIYLVSGEWYPWRNSTLSILDISNGNLLKRMEFLNEKISLPFTEQYLSLIENKIKGQVIIFNN